MQIEELALYLKLLSTPGVGNSIGLKLLNHFGSVSKIFTASKKEITTLNQIGNQVYTHLHLPLNAKQQKYIDEELEYITTHKIDVVCVLDEGYPEYLKYCYDPPILLFMKGNIHLKNKKIISVIGTRKLTKHGAQFCEELLTDLQSYNPVIISGFAYGADIFAHLTAVKLNLQTIAVLPNGLKQIYPKEHEKYINEICLNGGLITEFWSSRFIDKENFVKRNRIVAGISVATILIESASKGGSLITTNFANDYNRDVFAVPGRVTDLYSEGSNQLIKENKAQILTNAQDIIKGLNWDVESANAKTIQTQMFVELSEKELSIANYLKKNGKSLSDLLAIELGMSLSETSSVLLNLELKGVIKTLPGRFYELI